MIMVEDDSGGLAEQVQGLVPFLLDRSRENSTNALLGVFSPLTYLAHEFTK